MQVYVFCNNCLALLRALNISASWGGQQTCECPCCRLECAFAVLPGCAGEDLMCTGFVCGCSLLLRPSCTSVDIHEYTFQNIPKRYKHLQPTFAVAWVLAPLRRFGLPTRLHRDMFSCAKRLVSSTRPSIFPKLHFRTALLSSASSSERFTRYFDNVLACSSASVGIRVRMCSCPKMHLGR